MLEHQLARAFAAAAARGLRALRRSGAAARLALSHLRDLQARLAAVEHVVEGDLEVVPEVGAALTAPAATAAAPTAPAEDVSEEIVEQVPEVAEVLEAGARMAARSADTGVAELVVARLLLRIGEHGVCLGDLFEALLGLGIIRITVRVTFHRELAVGLLEVALGDATVDAEHLVVVPLAHVRALLVLRSLESMSLNEVPRGSVLLVRVRFGTRRGVSTRADANASIPGSGQTSESSGKAPYSSDAASVADASTSSSPRSSSMPPSAA